ncbi:DUF2956 domain-containing protein [Salinivibrio kushneri]|uniref:DUF2956 domain-containing protein n=1 Tax=Salinivibrio kushneri TaxID=1908198 RepID=UPI0009863E93|nr:DUF2956 domain-containing protein [Salinivibrio kushneri]OOE53616.1 hypothetical protein BZG11_01780 [Salinivibrio kushneri]OOE54865.1 hypothetical protein BZG10_03635 [Salinivibrio kushneri]OOE63348.1 hypothetical protein BZG18_01405 [Salinivibrio kushneri]
MAKAKATISPETQQDAMRVAKDTQKPGQTKAQTKLIAQGIEKGIAQYKKEQKAKARAQDKARKKQQKATPTVEQPREPASSSQPPPQDKGYRHLPWLLLVVSWIGFIGYALVGA